MYSKQNELAQQFICDNKHFILIEISKESKEVQ